MLSSAPGGIGNAAVPLARLRAAAPGRRPSPDRTCRRRGPRRRRQGRQHATSARGRFGRHCVAPSLPASTAPAAAPRRRRSRGAAGCGCRSARGASGRGTRCRSRVGRDIVPALRLVHPHHAVVVVGDRAEIAGRPAVHEGVCVDAGHAPLGHLGELEIREPGQLGEQDRIEVGILRRRAAVGVHQRLRLVQVVHDRRMRREVPVGNRAHRHLREIDVAIVVVVDVLSPVRHGCRLPPAPRPRQGPPTLAAPRPVCAGRGSAGCRFL